MMEAAFLVDPSRHRLHQIKTEVGGGEQREETEMKINTRRQKVVSDGRFI